MLFRLIVCNNYNIINKQNNCKHLTQKCLLLLNQNNNKIQLKSKYFSTFIINNNKINRNAIHLVLREEVFGQRYLSSNYKDYRNYNRVDNKNTSLYATAFVCVVLGATYASVPLYRFYCQSTGKGGKAFIDEAKNKKIAEMQRKEERLLTVSFSAETTSLMSWNFKPTQDEIKCFPGETVLAFFTAKNPLDRPIDGIATYSVQPYEAGSYLNKIQCFCFEEQRLNPQEEVDLPVFFYIDPEYCDDPKLENVDTIVLSYTFFEAKKGSFQLPSFMGSQPIQTQTKQTLAL